MGTRKHLVADVFNTTKIYQMYILQTLTTEKTIYGRQLYLHFVDTFKHLGFPTSFSTIYNTFHRMEEDGLITSTWGHPKTKNKRYYKITNEGLRYHKMHYSKFVDDLHKQKALISKLTKTFTVK
ncbi:MAG: PadR family transcriptional regulator [Candidatus Woesearchaeota archaeon]